MPNNDFLFAIVEINQLMKDYVPHAQRRANSEDGVFKTVLTVALEVILGMDQKLCCFPDLVQSRFTAVFFQVIGHMKTILVLIMGVLFFGKEGLNLHVVVGMVIDVIGMIWFGNEKGETR
ncbi:hypothetical protein SAY86_031402 [Trapa natans]|uniref:Uncharacterized protein n=1 Tax=Trapa natans TaxID=22666 RepID=A0AAN7LST2_TRANT|nr:hypothetical protein SAY86_031402 [Trapa natans]